MHEYASVTLAKMRGVDPLELGRARDLPARRREDCPVWILRLPYMFLPFDFSFHIRTGTWLNQRLSLAMPLPSHPGLERRSKPRGFHTKRGSSSSCRKTDELHRHARR